MGLIVLHTIFPIFGLNMEISCGMILPIPYKIVINVNNVVSLLLWHSWMHVLVTMHPYSSQSNFVSHVEIEWDWRLVYGATTLCGTGVIAIESPWVGCSCIWASSLEKWHLSPFQFILRMMKCHGTIYEPRRRRRRTPVSEGDQSE